MKRFTKKQTGWLVKECRWRIEAVLKSGGTVADIAEAAKTSTTTIYNYMGGKRWIKNGNPEIAASILAVFGAKITVKSSGSVRIRETI